ncbi:fibronectin type III domain-containing protein [Kutzneria sp. NPDC052558]|uniref:fibronectin type III domain-containing protein n=1 Tax=Kutzneria sp. NPDC052558 TaxID=3364121 RepID=UPI0037C78780
MSGRTTRLLAAAAAALLAIAVAQAPSAAAAPDAKPAKADSADKPYMGFSTWSLESTNYPGVNPTGPASWLNEANVIKQTDVVASTLKSHGYQYVNVDAGWMGGYDSYARPLSNATTFPHGMKYLGDYIHGKGLKFGAYLAVGLDIRAYNNGNTPIYGAKNCYTRNLVYPDLRTTNGWNSSYKIDFSNPCAQAYINSVANELAGWGVDFLKLDGVGPGSFQGGANYDNTSDVQAWNTALAKTGRKIQFVISWSLSHRQADVWKANSNGWRVDTDVECYCDTIVTWNNSVKARFTDVVQWIPDAGPGHWNNLDSLDVGNGKMDGITDAERQTYMTLWAIEAAPLYAGDDLTKLDSYGLSLLTNDEVIAVDQAGIAAKPLSQSSQQQTWYARNADGSYTVALFNLGDATATVSANLAQLGITGSVKVRDLWSHKDLANASGTISAQLPTHGSQLLKITPTGKDNVPNPPGGLHATAASGTTAAGNSVTLAWDPAYNGTTPATSYEIYNGTTRLLTTSGTSATVASLAPSGTFDFTVVAIDRNGKKSQPSTTFTVSTADKNGSINYEAEASVNTVAGGASVNDCGPCSGGKKVGNLGGTGSLTFPNVWAPKDGTYLMTVSYVDGDSSRTAQVTVNGVPFRLPLAGSNDNDWNTPQTAVVPITLKAGGSNVVVFNGPTPQDYVSDIDKITI